MALTTGDLSAAQDILKEIYDQTIPTVFNNETVLLSRLKRRQGKIVGKQFVFALRTTRNFGTAARPETGVSGTSPGSQTHYLPPPGSQGFDQGILTPAHYYSGFKLTGPAVDAAQGEGTLVDLLAANMDGARRDIAKKVNRHLFSDGSGAFGKISSGGLSTTLTITPDVNQFEVGDKYAACASNDGSSAVEVVVTSIDKANSKITVDVNTAEDNEILVSQGLASTYASEYLNAIEGLDLITADSTGPRFRTDTNKTKYAGIDKANNAFWEGTRIDGSNGLTIDLMLQAIQEVRGANGKTSLIITSPKQWRAYGNLMYPDRRWVDKVERLDGGFEYLDCIGIPVVYDIDCHDDVMYFLDESTLTLLTEGSENPTFITDQSGNAIRFVGTGSTAEDAFEVRLKWRVQLACNNCKANAVIHSLP